MAVLDQQLPFGGIKDRYSLQLFLIYDYNLVVLRSNYFVYLIIET